MSASLIVEAADDGPSPADLNAAGFDLQRSVDEFTATSGKRLFIQDEPPPDPAAQQWKSVGKRIFD